MVHYYQDLWERRSRTLSPLTDKRVREVEENVWTKEGDLSFKIIQQLLVQDIMLAYPNFKKNVAYILTPVIDS